MKRFGPMLGLAMASLLFTDGGWAGVKHFLASNGSDANPCTQASPCRSFAKAVTVTDPGGEVIVLDTGGYGSVTITKSISLIAPVGMYASVTPSSGTDGITINAGALDRVLLRGLMIKGTPGSMNGILVNTTGVLIVDHCIISGVETGIDFRAPNSKLFIQDSKFDNNTLFGVHVANSSGSTSVSMNNVQMVYNLNGLSINPDGTGSVSATVTNSLANHNDIGFVNVDISSGTSVLNLEHCVASENGWGIYSANNSVDDAVLLSNCTVSGNSIGVNKEPGTLGSVYTRQTNTFAGNATNSNVIPTPLSAW